METARTRGYEDQAPPQPVDRFVVQISVVLLLLFAASVGLLWRLGVFDTHTRASNAQILAAALGLVGVLVTASLTFVGVLLRYSIDARTSQRAAEEDRRQQLETSIRAVELLTEDGKPATPTRQAGALFVLISQNQLEFAFALLGQMWANGEISPGAAVWVVNELLLRGDGSLQAQAAQLLDANAGTLVTPRGYEYPECVNMSWRTDLSSLAREYLVSTLPKIVLAQHRDDWEADALNGIVVQLYLISKTEDELAYIRNGALVCLDSLLTARPLEAGISFYTPGGVVGLDEMTSHVKAHLDTIGTAVTDDVVQLAERVLSEWGSDTEEPGE